MILKETTSTINKYKYIQNTATLILLIFRAYWPANVAKLEPSRSSLERTLWVGQYLALFVSGLVSVHVHVQYMHIEQPVGQ